MSGIHNQYVDARRSRAISIAKQGSKGFGRVISNPKGGLHGGPNKPKIIGMHGQIMSYHATPLDSLQERVITTWVQQNRKELKGVESRWRIIKDQAGRDPMKILHELFEIAKKPGHTLPAKFVEELKAFLES